MVFSLSLSFRVAQKREDAVSKEVTRKLSEADNRKMSRKEKDERWVKLFCDWLRDPPVFSECRDEWLHHRYEYKDAELTLIWKKPLYQLLL